MSDRRPVTIHPGELAPRLGNGRRRVEAEIGREWVRVWLPKKKRAVRVRRKVFDRVRVEGES